MMRPDFCGFMCRTAARTVGKHPIQIDFDQAVPPLVRIVLKSSLGNARSLRSRPAPDETGPWIDAGIGKHDIQPAIDTRGIVQDGIERLVIGDIHHLPADIKPGTLQPPGFLFDTLLLNVEDGHARPIGGKRFSIAQPDSTGSARDNNAIAFDIKKIRNLQVPTSIPD